jgi:hypothetical protein
MTKLEFPFTEQKIRSLKVGKVFINGMLFIGSNA